MHCEERTDCELVRAACAGDADAFGVLVERHLPAAQSVAVRMVSNGEIAGELAQEAILQAFLSLDRLRNEEVFKYWLMGIVINLCRGYLRNRKISFLSLEDLPENARAAPIMDGKPLSDPQQIAETHELERLVLLEIGKLPPGQQEALLLFYYRHLRLEEIAKQAGISIEAVKVRLHRARKQLRLQLLRAYPDMGWAVTNDQRRQTMIPVTIADVVRLEDQYIVILLDQSGQRLLPIWIGEYEAASIGMGVLQIQTDRPMTFVFMQHLISRLGAELEEVRVEALKENVFYGVAKIRQGKRQIEMDVRPSDVLALASRTGSPIYVGEEVMASAGVDLNERGGELIQRKGIQALMKEAEERYQATMAAIGQETDPIKKVEALVAYLCHP